MCGIFGFITTEKGRGASARLKFVTQAMYVGTMRGADSAGMMFMGHTPREGGADWIKSVGTGQDFLNTDYAKERLVLTKFNEFRSVVGHNRSATYGEITTNNAHPFQEGPITLVHNGTIDTTYGMPVSMHNAPKKSKIKVDSHLICHNLALHETKEVLESLDGAYVLVWHDARNDTIYMARNAQRPLHLMRPKCEDTVLFASEADMLWWLAGRNSFSRSDLHSLDPGVLVSFAPGSTQPTTERYSLYKPKTYSDWRTGGRHTGKAQAPATSTGATTTTTAGTTKTSRKLLEEVGVDPSLPLEFSPESVIPYPSSQMASVNGWAYIEGPGRALTPIQAIIHGVDRNFASSNYDMIWQVRPLGVTTVGSGGKAEPALICRVVRVLESESKGSERAGGGRGALDLFQGPNNTWMTEAEWLSATGDGCSKCGSILTLSDARDVSWTGGRDPGPVCSICARHWVEDAELMRRMI